MIESGFKDFLAEQMNDPEFKREWDALEPEYAAIGAKIDAMETQKQTRKEYALPRRYAPAAV